MSPCRRAHQPRQRSWKIVAKRAVLAAGALERTIAFGNNDRPGVMLAGAARSYINRYAAAPGRRLAVFTNNDDGWRTAADARAAGIEVARGDRTARRRAGRAVLRARRQGHDRRARVACAWRARRAGDRRDRCRRPHDEDRMRCARGFRRLESGRASDLPPRRQAGVERGARGFRARRAAGGHACRRRGQRRA